MIENSAVAQDAPPAPPQPEKSKPSGLRVVVEWVLILAGAVLVAVFVQAFFLKAFYIPSESMLPALEKNDRVLVNKLSYDLHDVHRGDIVVFKSPPSEGNPAVKDLIKRVVGLPGETVEGRDGQVFINGKPIDESYLPAGVTTSAFSPRQIPQGNIWVMGDNRANSKDSRVFGSIPESLIVGRAFVRVWPPGALDLL